MKEENNQSNGTILYKMSGYLKIRFLGAIILGAIYRFNTERVSEVQFIFWRWI